LIAAAAIGVYTLFGQTLRNQTAGLALEVAGQDASAAIVGAPTNATAAQIAAGNRKGRDTYNAGNRRVSGPRPEFTTVSAFDSPMRPELRAS
jgi:hypothetical protein